MTSSPGPIPIASSASTSASVPFATPIARGTPRYSAASRSKLSTFGLRMKRPESTTSRSRAMMSGISGSYCALTSPRGMFWGSGTLVESSRASSQDQVHHKQHRSCHNEVVHVPKGVVDPAPVRPEPVARGGEAEAERDAADQRQRREPAKLQ